MNCPRCGLVNPAEAQRCDCGWDFQSHTVETAYFKQELPKDIRIYLRVLVVLNVLGALVALLAGQPARLVGVALWSCLVYWLYSHLVRKKNWARILLVIVTFPWGLFLGLSREARLYCLQTNE